MSSYRWGTGNAFDMAFFQSQAKSEIRTRRAQGPLALSLFVSSVLPSRPTLCKADLKVTTVSSGRKDKGSKAAITRTTSPQRERKMSEARDARKD
jgi:hypothetical protein